MARKVPEQKPGRSEQVVVTPDVFVDTVKRRLGIAEFVIDLAANEDNAKAPMYWGPEENSLIQPWHLYCGEGQGWGWLNPPYDEIAPWVKKANEERAMGAQVAMLLPAAVGSNWYAKYVHGVARVYALNGRIQFVGHPTPYPKDLLLLTWDAWTPSLGNPPRDNGFDVWRWTDDVVKIDAA